MPSKPAPTQDDRPKLIITPHHDAKHPPAHVDLGHSIDSAFPARFLKPWHLINAGVDTFTDTIKHIQWEQVSPDGKNFDQKLALYFERAKTPYLITAKTDTSTLRERYKVRTFGDLVGLRITIEIVIDSRHGEILRIKRTPPPARRAKAAPAAPSPQETAQEDAQEDAQETAQEDAPESAAEDLDDDIDDDDSINPDPVGVDDTATGDLWA